MTDRIAVLESEDYEIARKVLVADPIVIEMSKGLNATECAHYDGNPKFEFMLAANREYAKRGGKNQAHIGAVAEAILRLLTQEGR